MPCSTYTYRQLTGLCHFLICHVIVFVVKRNHAVINCCYSSFVEPALKPCYSFLIFVFSVFRFKVAHKIHCCFLQKSRWFSGIRISLYYSAFRILCVLGYSGQLQCLGVNPFRMTISRSQNYRLVRYDLIEGFLSRSYRIKD